ncbi:single-stranded DNA-binding protein [Patescibacteria group bacterium]|nr:single-stranded DNA-binding protein [Patescibacteria group bacterium]
MNFNKAIVIGRVTKDPEIRTTPNGQNVASIGLATNRVWNTNGGERQEKVEFHSIVAWGKLADICKQYLSKGQLVLFEGRLETRTWEGQDGVKRSKTEIIAENMQMGPRKSGSGGEENVSYQADNTGSVDHSPMKNANNENNQEEEIKIEDIPF